MCNFDVLEVFVLVLTRIANICVLILFIVTFLKESKVKFLYMNICALRTLPDLLVSREFTCIQKQQRKI